MIEHPKAQSKLCTCKKLSQLLMIESHKEKHSALDFLIYKFYSTTEHTFYINVNIYCNKAIF